jgi:hypothetical protein
MGCPGNKESHGDSDGQPQFYRLSFLFERPAFVRIIKGGTHPSLFPVSSKRRMLDTKREECWEQPSVRYYCEFVMMLDSGLFSGGCWLEGAQENWQPNL